MQKFQTIDCDTSQSFVVKHDYRVSIESEPLQRQDTVIWLHNHIMRVWENRVSPDQLLGIVIIETLEQVRAEP